MPKVFKNLFSEFKKFAIKGNMIDMAVGIIIGASFGGVVNSLVKDIIMPPLNLILAHVNFNGMFIVLKNGPDITGPYASVDAASQAGAVVLNLGAFFNTLVSFLIVAVAVFILIKFINGLRDKNENVPATTKTCPYCKSTVNIAAVKCPNCTSEIK